MFSPDQWTASTGVAFYNGVATQSLRFDDGSSAYLTRSPSSAGDRQTWIWSGWVKRANIGSQGVLFWAYNNINNNENYFRLTFTNDDELKVNRYTTNLRITNQLFRDVSSWYHIVCAMDTHQATANNRTLVYVNGEQITDFSTTDNYGQDDVTGINNTGEHRVGSGSASERFDGYMAEVNFIDGLSFFSDTSGTPNTSFNINSFGELKNGIWIAKEYTGSYGTNGFRLEFNQTGTGSASSSTIGADTSGNANHFTSSGIVASDCDMPDSPENNFATLNPLYATENANFSEGNLRLDYSSGTFNSAGSTIATGSMKFYTEVLLLNSTVSPAESTIGVVDADKFGWNTDNAHPYTGNNGAGYKTNNGDITNGYGTDGSGATLTSNDILGIACDPINGTVAFYKNGSLQDTVNIDTGLSYTVAMTDSSRFTNDVDFVVNYGQDSSFAGTKTAQGNTDANGIGDFYYSPPSGYLALCTSNLPEPTISPNADTQADDYFNTVTYTGDGTSSLPITGVGFQPDWLWIKRRNGANPHAIFDVIRGTELRLSSDKSDAELNPATDDINSFDTDGFTLNANGTVNTSSGTYVSWNWKAGGTAVSNTDGTITSSVSANTDAGFSIVSYTGNGTSGATIGHGLSQAPAMIIVKNRTNAYDWTVYHQSIGASGGIYLSLTNSAVTGYSLFWNDTAPTSTVVTLGTNSNVNRNGDNLIAYCFAEIEGYIKFGSYTGNGSSDGTFVNTGFRPAFCIAKRTDTANQWNMWDNQRSSSSGSNVIDRFLMADNSNDENTSGGNNIDLLSNGFKIRNGGNASGASGGTYIYMAFAENPFKYANAR